MHARPTSHVILVSSRISPPRERTRSLLNFPFKRKKKNLNVFGMVTITSHDGTFMLVICVRTARLVLNKPMFHCHSHRRYCTKHLDGWDMTH